MPWTSKARLVLSLALAPLGVAAPAGAQFLGPTPPSPPASIAAPAAQAVKSPGAALAEALAANPITAPYRFAITEQGRKVTLAGRVGDGRIHDVAVRTAIAMGIPISDQLVIDTSVGYAAGASANGPWPASPPASILTSYTYPPPLFGRYDEPFFGLEPPMVSYAPWWGAMSGYRLAQNAPIGQPQAAAANPADGPSLPPNTIEAAIDPRGVATLRGVVPTDAAKLEIGQRLARMPGISGVNNFLTIGPIAGAPTQGPRSVADDRPPPPPTPSVAQPRPDPAGPVGPAIRPPGEPANPAPAPAPAAVPAPAPAPARAVVPDRPPTGGLLGRIDRSIRDLPELADQPVKVTVRDGVASLSGSVPTVYEAMLAFRAVQQTPGVDAIVDTLSFTVPDGTTANPLMTKAKPEDVEPYLTAQIRRQVNDAAHLDRVRLAGDQLEVVGTLESADDRPRVEAILRSMPILRGFKILPEFRPLQR